MQRYLYCSILAPALLLCAAGPAEGQYRRRVEAPDPILGVSVSVGGMLGYDETLTPVATFDPVELRRGLRSVDAAPSVEIAGRYGRGIAVVVSYTAIFPGQAERSGNEPLTGAERTGDEDVGLISIASASASFTPLRAVSDLRLQVGAAWLDLGNGGSYLGVRGGVSARFLQLGENGGLIVAWDGFFAGGQHDRDGIERQIRGGRIHSVRLGYELAF